MCETIEQLYKVAKSKTVAPGKFKRKIRDKSNSFLSNTKILYPCFPTKCEMRLYFQQFNVNIFQEWRFPENSGITGIEGACPGHSHIQLSNKQKRVNN